MVAIDTLLQERYRIVRQLGQGGMGAVYKAIDERLTKPVAIKEILLELENSEDERQKEIIKKAFQREAANLVKARHAAVPDVTDFFSEHDRRYLVMEYIEGDDLARMLEKRRKPFTLLEVLPWINQLLEALNYLHSLVPPVVHRDIKPQNLKLNEWNKVKLLDFGIAKSTDKNTTLTQNTFLGATLSYSPIEQLMRVINPAFRELIFLKYPEKAERVLAQDTDGRSDLFALGATFYTLLTNRKPADATERALKIWEDGTDKLIHPKTFNPEIPESIAQWLIKSLAFDRENRFANAQEMQSGLQKALSEIKSKEDISDEETLVNTAAVPSSFENEKTETDSEILIETSPPITEPASSDSENESFQKPNTFPSEEISSTDYKLTNTDPSVANLEQSQFQSTENNENFSDDSQKTNSKNEEHNSVPPKPLIPISNNLKYILALPVIGITLFAILFISGYSFISLINFAKSFGQEKPQSESKVPAEPIPAVAGNTNLIPTTESSETSLNNSNTNQTTSTAKPTIEPKKQVPIKTSKPKVKTTPKPVATPKPKVKSTPKPAPKKKKTPRPRKKKVTLDDLINDN